MRMCVRPRCLTPQIIADVAAFKNLVQIASILHGSAWLDETDFVDVTGFNASDFQSKHGWSDKGTRLYDVQVSDRSSKNSYGNGNNIDLMAAINEV